MISIVIPVFNEEKSIFNLYEEVIGVISANRLNAEFIFADDGSTDGSWSCIEALARRDERVRGFRFRRNLGKAAALNQAFAEAKGCVIVTLDADLQDDPSEIPRLIQKIEEGWDLVTGWKKRRLDPWHKVFPSRVFNRLIDVISGLNLHDHNCGLKCYRSEVIREIHLYGELHRFITLLADSRGFKVTEIEVNHRPRQFDKSKYGASRFLKGFLDLLTVRFLTTYGKRPLHVFGTWGMLAGAVGSGGLLYLSFLWVIGERPIGNRPALFYSMALLLLGVQLLVFGILAELIVWKHSVPSHRLVTDLPISMRTTAAMQS